MDISIKASNLELTEALKGYVMEKIEALEKYAPVILRARIEVSRTTNHHHKGGSLWRAEANLKASKHLFRASASAADIYAAIDQLKDELKHELRSWKEKQTKRNVGRGRRQV